MCAVSNKCALSNKSVGTRTKSTNQAPSSPSTPPSSNRWGAEPRRPPLEQLIMAHANDTGRFYPVGAKVVLDGWSDPSGRTC